MSAKKNRWSWRTFWAMLLTLSIVIVFLMPAVSIADMSEEGSEGGEITEQATDASEPTEEAETDQENSENMAPDENSETENTDEAENEDGSCDTATDQTEPLHRRKR